MEYKDKVSIIIPTYNRAKLIKRSIDSVLNQTYDNIEVIVVDDCSTDNTEEVVKAIGDKRIVYIKLDKNSGACVARNVGIKHAKGKYITFNDSDDVFLPEKIEKQYKNLIVNKSDMDFCKINVIDDNNTITVPSLDVESEFAKNDYLTQLCHGNFISTQAIFIKRDIAAKVLFNEKLPRLQDYDFVLRCVPLIKLSYTSETLVNLYRQGDSISKSKEKLHKALLLMLNYDYDLNDENLLNLNLYLFNTLLEINGVLQKDECLKLVNDNWKLNHMNETLRKDYKILLDKHNALLANYNDIINSKRWKIMNKILKIFGK